MRRGFKSLKKSVYAEVECLLEKIKKDNLDISTLDICLDVNNGTDKLLVMTSYNSELHPCSNNQWIMGDRTKIIKTYDMTNKNKLVQQETHLI